MFLRLLIFAFIVMTTSTFAQTSTIDTGVSQTLAKWRGVNYSDVRYKLNLTLEKMSPTLKGVIEVSVNLKTASDIVLDWRKIKGKEQFYKIANVELNGAKVEAKEINEHLVIANGKQGANTIKLNFESPIATSGAAITRYVDKEDGAEYVYSLFVPSDASTAFPVFDQPDLKARFQLNATIPRDWKAVSNTIQRVTGSITKRQYEERREGGGDVIISSFNELEFLETKPISTYVFAFAAGDFTEFDETSRSPSVSASGNSLTSANAESKTDSALTNVRASASKIYVRKSQVEKFKQHAAETFRLNREAVKYLESYFDYKFPFPKYDLVLIPEFPFGGMEHAGATFLRESSVIFPSEPTANDYISRANLIFHEAAHQWFGDTVTMKWFDDLWLKEGFAEFMAYKTLAKVLPEYNAWKAFYERNKPLAYLTDSTKGTTPIYQEIPNLSQAKSAYGNIVYRKAPSFLRQAEFFLGEDKFQTAVRAFLKKHEFANAEWTDLVKEFETSSKLDLKDWADSWVKQKGVSVVKFTYESTTDKGTKFRFEQNDLFAGESLSKDKPYKVRRINFYLLTEIKNGEKKEFRFKTPNQFAPRPDILGKSVIIDNLTSELNYLFPNYQDYGYGIFLLDEKSRDYVLKNIQTEPDDFLRSMMWGTLWDSVREAELAPRDYVELAIKNIGAERDELTIQTILGRVSTAMNYYLSDKQRDELAPKVEAVLLGKMRDSKTLGQRITFYRAYLNNASSKFSQEMLKKFLKNGGKTIQLEINGDIVGQMPTMEVPPLKTKDKFDIVTKLLILENKRILGNNEAEKLLAELEKTETSDDAKRYAYAAKAGIATAENKQKFFNDFVGNKEISESYIETAFVPFNSTKHADLTLPFLENALKELPNLKRSRKIFFVNGWLSAFIGGQKSEQALAIVNKFLADNPNLDKDLRLKVLEVADGLERAVKIRKKFPDTK